jgi:hypothetical protein
VFIGPHFSSLAYFVVIFKILPTLSTRGELTKEKRNHGTNLITAKLNGLTHTHNAKKETNIKEIKTNTKIKLEIISDLKIRKLAKTYGRACVNMKSLEIGFGTHTQP